MLWERCHQLGLCPPPFKAKTFMSTILHLGMPYASGMAGNPFPVFYSLVYVANLLLWMEHSLSCQHEGYPIHRHNDQLRDYTASSFNKVCLDVSVEPPLQPLLGEQLSLHSANWNEGVRLDIAATNFWSKNGQRAFFDIRVFNPVAQSNHTLSWSCYQKHEQEKWRRYDQCVREVEQGCFSPLVFNTLGSMGATAWVVHKRLASLIVSKQNNCTALLLGWFDAN